MEKDAMDAVHKVRRQLADQDCSLDTNIRYGSRNGSLPSWRSVLLVLVLAVAAASVFIYWDREHRARAFQDEVRYLLENQVAEPRHGVLTEPTKVEVVNQQNADGSYLIGTFSPGDHLTEIGQFSDGRVLVCDVYSRTFAATEHCETNVGVAFLVSADLMR